LAEARNHTPWTLPETTQRLAIVIVESPKKKGASRRLSSDLRAVRGSVA
jgi:hypothetical protein